MASTRNVAVVLAAHGAPMVSIDISVAVPGKASSDNNEQQQSASAAAAGSPMLTSKKQQEPPIARIVEKNMLRPRDDTAIKTLERLRLLLGPPDLLKSRHGKRTKEELLHFCPSAELLDGDGEPMKDLDQLTNDVAWKTAKSIRLAANTPIPLLLPIRYNLPTVTAVTPPNVVFVGVPSVCSSVTTMFASDSDLLYEWRVAPLPQQSSSSTSATSDNSSAFGTKSHKTPVLAAEQGELLSTTAVIVPPLHVLGKRLRFRVRVQSEDSLWTEVESPPVLATPRGFHPMPRWSKLKPRKEMNNKLIRCVSYNILHDGFCTSKHARAKLFPFAPMGILDMNYRRARIAQELMVYDGDIIGLQECGRNVFDNYIDPILRSRGYSGKLRLKNNTSREGVALLLRKERFDIEQFVDVSLNLKEMTELIEKEKENGGVPQLKEIFDNDQFREALEEVPSVGLICVAFDKVLQKRIIIGNTHLYYHADGCHIRIIQTFMLMRKMNELAKKLSTTTSTSTSSTEETATENNSNKNKIPQILLGDFNMTRTTGGYALVTKGKVEKGHHSWGKSQKYFWGISCADHEENGGEGSGASSSQQVAAGISSTEPESEIEQQQQNKSETRFPPEGKAPKKKCCSENLVAVDLSLEQGPMIDCFANDPTITCTNYSIWFKEILDHIFVSSDCCRPVNLLPTPSQEELSKNIAIPSYMYPSDHVALVADIEML